MYTLTKLRLLLKYRLLIGIGLGLFVGSMVGSMQTYVRAADSAPDIKWSYGCE